MSFVGKQVRKFESTTRKSYFTLLVEKVIPKIYLFILELIQFLIPINIYNFVFIHNKILFFSPLKFSISIFSLL